MWNLRLREAKKLALGSFSSRIWTPFCISIEIFLFLYILLRASNLEHTRSLTNIICFFQFSDNTLSSPGKSHKVIQWVSFVSHQVMWTVSPNRPVGKISKVRTASKYQVRITLVSAAGATLFAPNIFWLQMLLIWQFISRDTLVPNYYDLKVLS